MKLDLFKNKNNYRSPSNINFKIKKINNNYIVNNKVILKKIISIILLSIIIYSIFNNINLNKVLNNYDILDTNYNKQINYSKNIILNKTNWQNNNTQTLNYKSEFPFYIFQIGFNKCGTTSLFRYFKSNKISALHYSFNNKPINTLMFNNYIQNKPILNKRISKKFMYFGDCCTHICANDLTWGLTFLNSSVNEYKYWYELINKQYPDSKYILNIRPVNNWLKSRYIFAPKTIEYIKSNMNNIYKNDIDIIINWKKLWYNYICDLLDFFEKNNLLNNLIIFNIEKDSFTKLRLFFQKFNLTLNNSSNFHFRKTKSNPKQLKKWENITINYPEFLYNNYSEKEQIKNICKS